MDRISFDKNCAEHLYELTLQNYQGGCYYCDRIKRRLEQFIGDRSVKHTKRIIKKYPYGK